MQDLGPERRNLAAIQSTDTVAPGWDDEGRVLAAAQFLRSSLGRLRPDKWTPYENQPTKFP